MERSWVFSFPFFRIAAEEPSGGGIVVSGAEVVEAEVGVILFAAIEVVVGSRADFREASCRRRRTRTRRSRSGWIGQLADAARAIVAIEAWRPGAIDHLVFADALQAVGVSAPRLRRCRTSSKTCGRPVGFTSSSTRYFVVTPLTVFATRLPKASGAAMSTKQTAKIAPTHLPNRFESRCVIAIHSIPGPQLRGAGATLIVPGDRHRDRVHPPHDTGRQARLRQTMNW